MDDPKIIDSPLSRVVDQGDVSVEICIYRLEETDWTLEVVAENGTSTVWEDQFSSDEVALAEALNAIAQDGIESFSGEADEARTLH